MLQTFEYFRYRERARRRHRDHSELHRRHADGEPGLGARARRAVALEPRRTPRRGARSERPADLDRRLADAYGVAAVVFSLLYLLMSRFSLYAIPFATLWALDALRARGREIGGRTRLPWSRAQVPLALAAARLRRRERARGAAPMEELRPAHAGRAGRGPPARSRGVQRGASRRRARSRRPGSRRRSTCCGRRRRSTSTCSIRCSWPRAIRRATRRRRTSSPARSPTCRSRSRSRSTASYLAYSPYAGLDLLTARLEHDPRVAIRHRLHGFNLLWAILPDRNDAFVLDWFELPAQEGEAPPTLDPGRRRPAPLPALAGRTRRPSRGLRRHPTARRPGAGCIDLAHIRSPRRSRDALQVELAPWGPSTAWLNGNEVAGIGGEPKPCSGAASRSLSISLPASNLLAVRTCPGKDEKGPRGFYLRRLGVVSTQRTEAHPMLAVAAQAGQRSSA